MLTERKTMLESIDTPLIAILYVDKETKMYGPFDNGRSALEWYDKQPKSVRIGFSPLRNPDVERTYEDFYLPLRMESEDREFNRRREGEPVVSGL
jgi:hypothetical protein